LKTAHYVTIFALAFSSITISVSAQSLYKCDNCSRFVEIDKAKAKCFLKRYDAKRLLKQFSDETIKGVPVNFDCKAKSRSVVSTQRKTKNDFNSHILTKDAITCLHDLIVGQAETFTPSRLISFEKHCNNG